jgi:hypothetical protein
MQVTDRNAIADEIESRFPFVDRPLDSQLCLHPDAPTCSELLRSLGELQHRELRVGEIRVVHQLLNQLSPRALLWILPSYLRYCVTAEAEYSRMEVEFLIYSFGPELRFQQDAVKRLSLLSRGQIECLIDFISWCLANEFWRSYFEEDLRRAQTFLRTLTQRG